MIVRVLIAYSTYFIGSGCLMHPAYITSIIIKVFQRLMLA